MIFAEQKTMYFTRKRFPGPQMQLFRIGPHRIVPHHKPVLCVPDPNVHPCSCGGQESPAQDSQSLSTKDALVKTASGKKGALVKKRNVVYYFLKCSCNYVQLGID
jgi:hypothetical protein